MASFAAETDAQELDASESLTALVGLEVLFKAFAATEGGRHALHAAMDERLSDIETLSQCGVDPGPSRHVAHLLREMIERVAPLTARAVA